MCKRDKIEKGLLGVKCVYFSMTRLGDNISTVPRTKVKKGREWVSLSCNIPRCTQWTPLSSNKDNHILSPYTRILLIRRILTNNVWFYDCTKTLLKHYLNRMFLQSKLWLNTNIMLVKNDRIIYVSEHLLVSGFEMLASIKLVNWECNSSGRLKSFQIIRVNRRKYLIH